MSTTGTTRKGISLQDACISLMQSSSNMPRIPRNEVHRFEVLTFSRFDVSNGLCKVCRAFRSRVGAQYTGLSAQARESAPSLKERERESPGNSSRRRAVKSPGLLYINQEHQIREECIA